MSPETSHPIANRIDVWSCCAMLVVALAAAPLSPARADEDGRDKDGGDRGSEATTLSIPLSGTGVDANAGTSTGKASGDGRAKGGEQKDSKAGGGGTGGAPAKVKEGSRTDDK